MGKNNFDTGEHENFYDIAFLTKFKNAELDATAVYDEAVAIGARFNAYKSDVEKFIRDMRPLYKVLLDNDKKDEGKIDFTAPALLKGLKDSLKDVDIDDVIRGITEVSKTE